ncbi:hypothetical protein JAAARDRAFT_194867 [Jaapia argillacea MUCL 33604]|uniref:Uncharacterized protein n=1 Tax=Jaapia argillacea MUCL 33604 TaxID=933084 RepID=A0A067PSX4_9AGAM|nr:hypothetical protein JAAARDRAFT_194867 [Jaapia argillacea MUCL 33604]
MINGEIVETTWRPLDEIAGCTWTVTTSHREETLNDHMGFWNFMKFVNMTSSICRKLKAACEGVGSSTEAFEDLDARIGDEIRKEWLEQEQDTYRRRLDDPSVMDIFDVSSAKGEVIHPPDSPVTNPIISCGKKEVQLELMTAEQPMGLVCGTIAWLIEGFKLQESQLDLVSFIRQLGKKPSLEDRLEHDIHEYCLGALTYLGHSMDSTRSDGGATINTNIDKFNIMEDDDPTEFLGRYIDPEESSPVEQAVLPLPSSMGLDECKRRKIGKLAELELQLRIGQANDALHEIRIALGHKSFLFRTKAPVYWLLGMSYVSGHLRHSALIQAMWTELQQASHRFHEINLSGYHPTPVDDDPLPKWWLAADPRQGVAQFCEMFLPVDLDEQKKPPISKEAELCDFQNLVNLYRHLILKELQHDAVEDDTNSDPDDTDSDPEDTVDQLDSDEPMEESNPTPPPLRADGEVDVLSDGRSSTSSSSSNSDKVQVFSIHGAGSPSPSKVGRAAESSSNNGSDGSPSPSLPGGPGEKQPNNATNLYPADRVLDDAWDVALGVLQPIQPNYQLLTVNRHYNKSDTNEPADIGRHGMGAQCSLVSRHYIHIWSADLDCCSSEKGW